MDRFAIVDGSYQHNLLRDAKRTDAFAEAIACTVREGDVVADLGSGSGVLAHLAAKVGARRVYAVEANRGSHATLQGLLRRNGLEPTVQAVLGDAEAWVPPEPVDVVLCELMETGLLHEPMAAAVRSIHERWPTKPRAIVPRSARLLVEGVELQDRFHGFEAPLPGFRAEASGEPRTSAASYAELNFAKDAPPERVDARFALQCSEAGRVDALRLRTLAELAEGIVAGPSPGFCTPVVLPLPEPIPVRPGQTLQGSLAYAFAFDEEPITFGLERA